MVHSLHDRVARRDGLRIILILPVILHTLVGPIGNMIRRDFVINNFVSLSRLIRL